MSNHNYTQYSNNKKYNETVNAEVDVCVEEITTPTFDDVITTAMANVDVATVESTEAKMVEGTTEPVVLAKTVNGKVINCAKLNVRENPSLDADIVCVLNVNAEIEINVEKTTNEWVNVYTETGIEGYCMRKYVEIHL